MKTSHLAGWILVLVGAVVFVQVLRQAPPGGGGGGRSSAGSGGGKPTTSSLTRKSLGIFVAPTEGGVQIDTVVPGGAGERAGLRMGDVIVEFEGQPIETHEPIIARLNALKTGEVISLKVRRPGGPIEAIVVRFGEEAGYEQVLARTLIKQGVGEMIGSLDDIMTGLYPHYQDPSKTSVGVTALVAYALARAGEDLDEGQRGELKATLQALYLTQADDGGLDDPGQVVPHRVYATSLYLMALSLNPEADPKVTSALKSWLTAAQVQEARGFDSFDSRYGGWSYYDTYRTSLRTDVSTARFALQALAAAELPPEAPAWQRASLFLDELQNHSLITGPEDRLHTLELEMRDGGFSFIPRTGKAGDQLLGETLVVGKSYGSATADGLLGLLSVLGIDRGRSEADQLPRDDRVLAALTWLATHYTVDEVPGFGADPVGWSQGLYFYFAAAQAEAFHRAGVWEIETEGGERRRWAVDLVRKLGDQHARRGRNFSSDSGLMHEDEPVIASAFAIIALAAARDRLALGAGAVLKAGAAPTGPPRDIQDPSPQSGEEAARGLTLMRERFGCFACHFDEGNGNGPSLVGVADAYLARYRTEARVRGELKQRLRAPAPGDALLGGEWPAPMPLLFPASVPDADVEAVVTFLLSCSGDRPVSGLR